MDDNDEPSSYAYDTGNMYGLLEMCKEDDPEEHVDEDDGPQEHAIAEDGPQEHASAEDGPQAPRTPMRAGTPKKMLTRRTSGCHGFV